MPVTIKDVAKRANVSNATVTLVLQDHNRISSATKKRVLKAVSDLNYKPSRLARGLVMKQTHNIGFLLTDDHFLRTEPFYTHIFLGTEFEAREYEYYVLLNTIPSDFRKCTHLPRFVLENNVDGVIIAGKVPVEIIECMESYNLPIVFVDYYPHNGEYCAVLIDNVQGAAQATCKLIEHGHKNIAFIGGDFKHPSIRDRYEGYKQALEENNIRLNNKLVIKSEKSTSRHDGYHAMKILLENNMGLTAVFASNDAMAFGALQYLRECGQSVPDDISVIGFDDVDAAAYSNPPLSSMRVPKVELGTEAMRLMINMLKQKNKKTKKILVPVEFVSRESVKVL